MLDLRQNITVTALVPLGTEFRRVTGRVIGQTFEADPVLELRLDNGAIARVRLSEAEVKAS